MERNMQLFSISWKEPDILLQGNGSAAGLLHFPNIHANRLNDYENWKHNTFPSYSDSCDC